MADARVHRRFARAGRLLGVTGGARHGYDAHSYVRVRVLRIYGGRALHQGGRSPLVVAPVVQGGVTAARAAAADKQRGEPGLGDLPVARPPHAPPVLEHTCGLATRAAGAHGLVVDPTGASCCRRWCPRALGQGHVEHVHGLRRD